jgi:hypothetical protein
MAIIQDGKQILSDKKHTEFLKLNYTNFHFACQAAAACIERGLDPELLKVEEGEGIGEWITPDNDQMEIHLYVVKVVYRKHHKKAKHIWLTSMDSYRDNVEKVRKFIQEI